MMDETDKEHSLLDMNRRQRLGGTTPTSGVIGSLRVVVLLNTVLIHLGTVCFYEDAPAITALQQEAIMSPDMIVDAGVISCGITARGAVSKSGGLSAVRPPRILLANGVVLMDAIQPYHQVSANGRHGASQSYAV